MANKFQSEMNASWVDKTTDLSPTHFTSAIFSLLALEISRVLVYTILVGVVKRYKEQDIGIHVHVPLHKNCANQEVVLIFTIG